MMDKPDKIEIQGRTDPPGIQTQHEATRLLCSLGYARVREGTP